MAKLRPDQEDRLTYIEEKLMDVFLEEADPGNWTDEESAMAEAARLEEAGCVKEAAKLRSEWKGQRYWEKKNANGTMALLSRILYYRAQKESAGEQGSEPSQDEKDDIAKAEKKVKAKLYAIRKKAA